ncbi:MAG: hypothetical protein IMZ52_02895 [Actinobacteria bacterium]|nr:hypothetical protein [Actinomycetota bacterium]MBE3114893.1 hypothetical protein [Actinomycetota bacterium]
MGDGDINLIAKIAPFNDGFVGMVDASQVIGTSGGALTSYLPSSAISSNSITENYLKISNSPTDGYYLQYKDDTDRLTWEEVIASNVSTGFSTISNGYGAIGHSLGAIPKYVNITPSGSLYNFGASCKVDATNIYVYLTAMGSRSVYWYAST